MLALFHYETLGDIREEFSPHLIRPPCNSNHTCNDQAYSSTNNHTQKLSLLNKFSNQI